MCVVSTGYGSRSRPHETPTARTHRGRPVTAPYYSDDHVTLYHGDCLELADLWTCADVLVTDPPYPNNAGLFLDGIAAARVALVLDDPRERLVFWNELEFPPSPAVALVAVHIWHRSNVNGRPYEPVFHFAPDGKKRRSEVFRHAVEFQGATGADYLGHPTQKPVDLMRRLVAMTTGVVADPFAGSGSTLRAAKDLGRKAIGIELDERYCEIAAKRLAQEVLAL